MKTIIHMTLIRLISIGLVLRLSIGMAQAAVVVVVSARNPVTMLDKNQIMNIFLGKESRFPSGGLAVPIDQIESSATRDEFYFKFANKSPAQIKAYWSKIIFTGRGEPPPSVADDVEVKKRLLENPNAIGYIEQSQVDDSLKVLSK